MKVKKLIELLQAEDPTGETEVCIGNQDIFCLESKPAYWDGCLQILTRDWSNEFYNVTGAKYTSVGSKIEIRSMGIDDAIAEDPDLPVEVIDEFLDKRMAETVAKWRQEAREMRKNIDNKMLVEVLEKYREGWKAAQAVAEPLARCNVQWWWKSEDSNTKRLAYNEKDHDKQISLCQGHSQAVVQSGFFRPVNDGQRIVWEFNICGKGNP